MAEKIKKKRSVNKIIIGVVAVILAVALTASAVFYNAFFKTEDYTVVSVKEAKLEHTDSLHLIGHRGFRAVAPENTVPAYEEAGKAGFWGAECDIYRTKDGQWVLHHDSNTSRIMNGKLDIESSTYEELLKLSVKKGCNADKYKDLKIATLDEYLTACDNGKMTAVIELKSENTTKYYGEIIETVKKHKCDCMFISFHPSCLRAIRNLDNSALVYYLVNNITDESILTAYDIGNCGISFCANKKKNLKNDGERIRKVIDSGLLIAAWTVDDTELMQTLINYGVTTITTDCITY